MSRFRILLVVAFMTGSGGRECFSSSLFDRVGFGVLGGVFVDKLRTVSRMVQQ